MNWRLGKYETQRFLKCFENEDPEIEIVIQKCESDDFLSGKIFIDKVTINEFNRLSDNGKQVLQILWQ